MTLPYPAALAAVLLAHAFTAARAAEEAPEPWVKASEIVTSKVFERHAVEVAPGVQVQAQPGGWLWSPEVDGKQGVLIVHPPDRSTPAVIRPDLGDLNRRKDLHFLVTARGSNHLPGARLVVAAGDEVLAETTLGKEWTTTSVPVEKLLRARGKPEVRFHPTGWTYEYAYIDRIALGAAPADEGAAPGQGDPAFLKRLASGPWKWEAKAAAKPDWDEVVFREDGGFTASRGGRESYATKWRSPRPGTVEILNGGETGLTLEFSAGGLVFQARAKGGTPVAVGRPRNWMGLSVDPATDVGQNQGGKSASMEDLKFILEGYGEPKMDLDPHPEITIYKGPMLSGKTSANTRVGYLMPRADAEKALFDRRPTPSSSRAVAPGFPRGLKLWRYDIRSTIYNRVTLVTDIGDKVVCLQLKAENQLWIPPDAAPWKALRRDFHTFDFVGMEERGGGQSIAAHIADFRKDGGFLVINTAVPAFKETTTLYLPAPMANLILHNLKEAGDRLR